MAWLDMAEHDLKPGDRITCTHCGVVHEAFEDGVIKTREDARCQGCRTILTHWRQYVGLRRIETDGEVSA